ncbi:zonular occludens toxin domain-containing protein [Acinetobacter sp. VNH17]|uniref:Zonular occludens toxin domain-containing protein n=1 Tax=Acinetobacter thutiue TaxID=2998078 RepID=A0ABT7WKE2_9GAMM|nr:zonular occludens toxin domain-containing protein [Acinetobacter thutiue]MCY6411053.1 hypothetical protein [Acinetobacter thutiue]MDN0013155.1 zonular occludens toxin domain-containing protein [Acinetobacter thutiue]
MSTLRLITGGIGSGKSLWTVDQLFKLKDEQPDRVIYTDITGIQHTGIISVPEDFDWRDAVHNSLVVFDEVQYKELFSRHNSKRDKQILDLTTIRKRGIELWVITQRARFLNPDVLGLVNEHVHLEKKASEAAKVYHFLEAETAITAKKKLFAFKKYVFQYPKHLYGFYESIKPDAVHHKRSWVHQGIVLVIITMIIGLIAAFFTVRNATNQGISVPGMKSEKSTDSVDKTKLATKSDGSPESKTTEQQNQQQNQVQIVKYNPNQPYAVDYSQFDYQVFDKPVISGCIIYANECTCFTQQATKLDMSQKDCRRYMSGDRPFNAFRQPQQQQYQQPPAQAQQENQQYVNNYDAEYIEKMREAKRQGLIN